MRTAGRAESEPWFLEAATIGYKDTIKLDQEQGPWPGQYYVRRPIQIRLQCGYKCGPLLK